MEDAHVNINVNYSRKWKNYYTELKGNSNVRKLNEEAVCNSTPEANQKTRNFAYEDLP